MNKKNAYLWNNMDNSKSLSMKSRFALLAILVVLFSGCGVGSVTPRNDIFKIGKNTIISGYEVFQTLDSGFALAMNRNNFMVIAVKSTSTYNPMYDGEIISGTVVMIDTYSYETKSDEQGNRKFKTVPLVVPYSEVKAKQQSSTVN